MRPAHPICLALIPALAVLSGLPAFAQTPLTDPPTAALPMTGAEFDAYSRGKTLYYAIQGTIYGAEQYLSGRRVIWAFEGDECRDGVWYEQADKICFIYEHDATPQCWRFFAGSGGLRAQFVGDPPGSELIEVEQHPAPLTCAGPDVGV